MTAPNSRLAAQASQSVRQCPVCGKALAADAAEGLCASCLLASATETLSFNTQDSQPTISSAAGDAGSAGRESGLLTSGASWGPYRIGRLLGRGGMGEVYEAEHTGTGRRLALKVLRKRLQNGDDRARFLREGQLAASVSHPHTVYIFGSEEISGTPAISMELLPGGTLKDRVTATGPLPSTDAVAAVLDIIGGLDAAHAAGILHRDIKPSNCFVDRDGSVKVGDFGLSISTLARDVRADIVPEGFEGTPQFAAPEQLRGEPLDVRADIYAVGATLYYLLTGRPPFDAGDLQQLFNRVNTEPPPSPRTLRKEVPRGLAAIVSQCLAKSPGDRPATYAALADALRPYAPHEEAPARPGLRLVAGIVDGVIVSLISGVWKASQTDITYDSGETAAAGAAAGATWWIWIAFLAYYIGLEGLGGASLGKRALGLRVRTAGANWWPRIVVRTLVFYVPNAIVALGLWLAGPFSFPARSPDAKFYWNPSDMVELGAGALVGVLTLALFLTARRRNGWAGLHDLISGTRIVSIAAAGARQTGAVPNVAAIGQTAGSTLGDRVYGPFRTAADPGDRVHARSIVAYDPVLRRRVWIRTATEGTPAISNERRDVSRVGRLHWLTGRRSPGDNWDAFEAPDGAPFESYCDRPVEWATLKQWLLDLSTELTACTAEGTAPILAIDRLWLRGDGRLVLLDFPPPASRAEADVTENPPVLTPSALLSAVVSRCASPMPGSHDGRAPMPLSARRLLDRLASATPPPLLEAGKMLADAASTPNRVGRRRRAIPMAMAAAPMAIVVMAGLLMLSSMTRFISSPNTELLEWVDLLNKPSPPGSRLADPEIRGALETYLAGRFASALHDEGYWNSRLIQGNQLLREWRRLAADIAARHPSVDAVELARATKIVAPEIERSSQRRASRSGGFAGGAAIIVTTLLLITVTLAAIASTISSLLVRGGLVTRWLGLAAVTRDGREIGRARSIARSLVAWLPGIVWLGYMAASPKIQGWVPAPSAPVSSTAVMLGVLALGAAWTIARPARGPHDMITRTWMVPR